MFEAVFRKLARDQWVRLHGTPRVTVLVGGDAAREIWQQWVALSGLSDTLLVGSIDDRVREAVALATAEPARPIALLASAAAAAAWRAGRHDRLAAMVDEGWIELPDGDLVDAIGSRAAQPRPAHVDARSVGDAEARAAQPGPAHVGARSVGEAEALAAQPRPAHVGAGSVAEAAPVEMVEARPRPAHVGAGRVAEAAPFETVEAVEALGAQPRPALHIDARSVAEATLFEALEATPATAGRFVLNGALSVRFGASAAEVDLLSRGDRVAIEIDGYHHFADLDAYRRDRKKDMLLQGEGLFVVRVLADDVVRDVRAAVTTVCHALAYRRKERG